LPVAAARPVKKKRGTAITSTANSAAFGRAAVAVIATNPAKVKERTADARQVA
jgi:hypothetical protein